MIAGSTYKQNPIIAAFLSGADHCADLDPAQIRAAKPRAAEIGPLHAGAAQQGAEPGVDQLPGGGRADEGAVARLEADLAATDQDWIIAFWHPPSYTKGSHDSDTEIRLIEMRENLLPILENHGVDLVLTGHSHSYERSFLLDGHYGTSDTLTEEMQVDPGDWVRDMRRVMYCGEYLQSHALHVHLLAAPDFLGFDSAIAMAADHPDAVRRGLQLQRLGNVFAIDKLRL